MKNLKILSFLFAFLCIGLTSCGDDLSEGVLVDTENFTDSESSAFARSGGNACIELVYPITVEFEDNTLATVEDQEELKAAIQAWMESNLDADDTTETGRGRRVKPDVVFPIQIINQDGETVDINSEEELREAKSACGGGKREGLRNKGERGDRQSCFTLSFPLTYDFPDGSSVIFDDKESKKEALKAYREANGRDTERPTLAYPVTVEYEDGTTATAESKDALNTLKEECSESD